MENNVPKKELESTKEQEEQQTEKEQKERLFTQEEVNNIVQKRLAARKKEKEENQRTEEEYQDREKKVSEREKAVLLRENKVSCMEFLKKNNYPDDLIEILDNSDIEIFKKNAERLSVIYGKTEKEKPKYPEYDAEPVMIERKTSFSTEKHTPKYSDVRNW